MDNLTLYDLFIKNATWSRGLMDKALASGAGDCGFESHRDRFAFPVNLFALKERLTIIS